MRTLSEAACAILHAAAPRDKVALTNETAAAWANGQIVVIGTCHPPDRPTRPKAPRLVPPREMPRRRYGGPAGRLALFHALGHIELNAIDLAWDLVARFADQDLPRAFYDDWVGVARDEARHFVLLENLLARMGAAYGDLPAHDGLWQAAEKTTGDLLARLAVVPMCLEARGLDTTPATVARLRANGDDAGAAALEVICRDEAVHVAAGCRWFRFLCERRGEAPAPVFHRLVRAHFGVLKAPFNHAARNAAGMPAAYYEPLASARHGESGYTLA